MDLRTPARMVWCSALLALGVAACGGGGVGPAGGTVPAVAATRPLSVVVVGDSIAAGVMVPPSHNELLDPTRAWPGRVQTALGRSVVVTNLAIPGAQSQVVLDSEVPKIPPTADIVVDADGANDCSQGFTQPGWPNVMTGTDRIAAAVHIAAPNARMIFVTQRLWGANTAGFIPKVQEWNAHMRGVATANSAQVLDLEYDPTWYVASDWGYDFEHPTDSGAAKVAAAIAPLIAP